MGFSSPAAVASWGPSAAKAACASPGTPLSESAFPFEFNPNTTVIDAAAQQRCAMKRAAERAAAEHAVASSPPLAPSAGRSPDVSAKPVAAVAEVIPAAVLQGFRHEVAALILQTEALRQRKAKVERLKAEHAERRADAALSVQPKTTMHDHDHRQWEELRRVACRLWEADCGKPPWEAFASVGSMQSATVGSRMWEADCLLVSASTSPLGAARGGTSGHEQAVRLPHPTSHSG